MAENLVKVANMARILAIVHIIVGSLLFFFGIADRAVEYFWTGYGCFGIWIGVWVFYVMAYSSVEANDCLIDKVIAVFCNCEWFSVCLVFVALYDIDVLVYLWKLRQCQPVMRVSAVVKIMCIAGGLGIPGTRTERSTSRNAFVGVFMGFSITSAVFGGIIIICYSIAIAFYRYDYKYVYEQRYKDYDPTASFQPNSTIQYNYRSRRVREDNFDTEMALSVIILILGIVEFAIGIWAAVCLCMMKPCTCCYGNQQQGQVMYVPNSCHAMTQYPGGVPVTVPMQLCSGMIPIGQTVIPGPQGGQPQMVTIPVSGKTGNQPQFAQIATSGAMATTYHAQVPPKYEEGVHTKMGNDE